MNNDGKEMARDRSVINPYPERLCLKLVCASEICRVYTGHSVHLLQHNYIHKNTVDKEIERQKNLCETAQRDLRDMAVEYNNVCIERTIEKERLAELKNRFEQEVRREVEKRLLEIIPRRLKRAREIVEQAADRIGGIGVLQQGDFKDFSND